MLVEIPGDHRPSGSAFEAAIQPPATHWQSPDFSGRRAANGVQAADQVSGSTYRQIDRPRARQMVANGFGPMLGMGVFRGGIPGQQICPLTRSPVGHFETERTVAVAGNGQRVLRPTLPTTTSITSSTSESVMPGNRGRLTASRKYFSVSGKRGANSAPSSRKTG